MAILTLNSSLAEQTSSSPSWDSISIPRKTASGNSCKTWSAIQGFDRKLWLFYPLLKYGWPDLLVTELGFHVNPKENDLQKLVQIFEHDPTIGSIFFAILTRFSSLCDQTSLSLSWDSISIPRKTASKNSCKNSSAIQWWDQKGYGHFDPLLKSGRQDLHVTDARLADQTSSSMTSDSKATRRKMASEKSCKNLTVI